VRHMHTTVAAPMTPLYQMGSLGRIRRPMTVRRNHKLGAHVHAPQTPLYQLGYFGAAAQIVGASAPIAATATTGIISSLAEEGSTLATFAGPIGAGVGAVMGIISGLLAGHELRAKQAKNENSAVNIGVSGFDQDIKQIQQALQSGQIAASDVLTALPYVMQGFWTVTVPQIQPGRNGCNSGASCPPEVTGKQPCVGNIGAACCVGCYQLQPGITGPNGAIAAAQGLSQSVHGPYIAEIPQVFGSSYGTTTRGAYTLDFTPPATATSSLTSALTGSSSSMLPLLLAAAALVFLL
jgi:hypothetical protein